METIFKNIQIVVCLSFICLLGCALRSATNVIEKEAVNNEKQVNSDIRKAEKRREIRLYNYNKLIESAERWHGVVELTGRNDHPMIDRSMRLCGLKPGMGYAWCATCQADIHEYAGIANPLSGWVMSWFNQNVVWKEEFGELPKYIDTQGMAGGYYSSKLKRYAHIVLIVGETDKYYYIEGGNTSPNGAVEWDENIISNNLLPDEEREGDGYYRKIVDKRTIDVLADYCLVGKLFIDEYDWYLQKFL